MSFEKEKIFLVNSLFLLFLFGCFIPYQAILLPMSRTLGFLGMSNSISGLVLVHTVYGLSFTTLFFRNYYISIPDEMIKAARIDGAGFFKIFFKVLLPISAPIAVVTIIWQFTNIWNDFLFGSSFSCFWKGPLSPAHSERPSFFSRFRLSNLVPHALLLIHTLVKRASPRRLNRLSKSL